MKRIGWRTAASAGASVGLAGSSLLLTPAGRAVALVSIGVLCGACLGGLWAFSGLSTNRAASLTSVAAAAGCCLLGLLVGQSRIHGIEAGAAEVAPGSSVRARGVITAWTRESDGSALIIVETGRGRLAVRASERIEPDAGRVLQAEGRIESVPEWRADWFERKGIGAVLAARRVEMTDRSRGGLPGAIDAIRRRAEKSLSGSMAPTEAALAKGFVLGQDQEIPVQTEQEFRRSGLSHLLAVSGQNVLLLSILAWPFLALIGLRLPGRLAATAGLVVVYVLVTGAGPSIQRAGVMGLAAIGAGLNGRPLVRLHALLLACAITLAINPLSVSDPGWLLSFTATAGIMLWARPIADSLGFSADRSQFVNSIAEASAVTVAATLATAPVGAAIFGTLSLTALPANLIAAPAVAPSMWLGMLAASLGQMSTLPSGPLNWLNAHFLGYIETVAHLFGAEGWTMLETSRFAPALVPVCWAAVGLAVRMAGSLRHRRAGQGLGGRAKRVLAISTSVTALLVAVVLIRGALHGADADRPAQGFELCALDVGQGDSILLDPPGADAVLIDTGPPGTDIAAMLRSRGISELSSLIITHDQSDHNGGTAALLGSVPVGSMLYSRLGASSLDLASASGVALRRISEGDEVRAGGGLRISVLWPPGSLFGSTGGDPNGLSLVLLATWRHFSALLTADAEAEAVPVEPGAIDLLKVAHHGSVDQGLDGLLEHSVPKLALISVGDANGYGHPTAETLSSLSRHRVPYLRTDHDGAVGARVGMRGWRGGAC